MAKRKRESRDQSTPLEGNENVPEQDQDVGSTSDGPAQDIKSTKNDPAEESIILEYQNIPFQIEQHARAGSKLGRPPKNVKKRITEAASKIKEEAGIEPDDPPVYYSITPADRWESLKKYKNFVGM